MPEHIPCCGKNFEGVEGSRIIESLNIPYVSQVVGELLRRRLELKKVMKEASGKDQALYDMAKAQQTALTRWNFRRFSRGSEIRCYRCGRALKPGDVMLVHGRRRRRYCIQCAKQLHLHP